MSSKYHLCCLTKNRTNPAYEGARIGAERLAYQLGCELVNYAPNTPDDTFEQDALLNEALDSHPDAILIAPVHTTDLDLSLQKVRDAGIPLIFFVTKSDGVKSETFVTSKNHTLAVGIANYLFEHIGGIGDVAILEGAEKSPTSAPRTKGFRDAAAEYPDINIVASRVANYQRNDALREMTDILKMHPNIDGLLAANDVMAFGAIDALEAANHKASVIGLNAVPEAIKAIKNGSLLATVGYDAMSMVCIAVHAAVRILSGERVPEVIELPAKIVDANNCKSWDCPYQERPMPSWELVVENRL